MRHSRERSFRIVTVDGHVAAAVRDGSRFLQPFIDPLLADFCTKVGQIGSEHFATLDPLQTMTPSTIQLRKELAASIEQWRLRQRPAVAGAAGRLDVPYRQQRLFPRQRRLVCLRHLCRRTLAAVTNRTTPFTDAMRDRGMHAKWLRHRRVEQAGLCNSLVASGATVYYAQVRDPNLVDVGMVVGEQTLRVRPGLGKADVVALIALPFAKQILYRRDRQRDNEQHRSDRKGQPQSPRYLSHPFSLHEDSMARPMTTRAP